MNQSQNDKHAPSMQSILSDASINDKSDFAGNVDPLGITARINAAKSTVPVPVFVGVPAVALTQTWTGVNDALLIPVYCPVNMAITRIGFFVNVSSGNVDIGVYNSSLVKIASKGSTVCPGAGAASLLLSATLPAGTNYLALAFDNTTVQVSKWSGGPDRFARILAGTGFPLPNSLSSSAFTQHVPQLIAA